MQLRGHTRVALLAEGVDRNLQKAPVIIDILVALLAEGVDRNSYQNSKLTALLRSPSSRRAWIEIALSGILSR